MKEPKGFASLSSSLLARKGQARPAMRPNKGQSLEDLGWNDMGHDLAQTAPGDADRQAPAPVKYQEAIRAKLSPIEEAPAGDAKTAEAKPKSKPAGKRATRAGTVMPLIRSRTKYKAGEGEAKAAFTLRLDPERHLRLRLACAITNQSAQTIVTQALDALLDGKPELNTLADQLPPLSAKH